MNWYKTSKDHKASQEDEVHLLEWPTSKDEQARRDKINDEVIKEISEELKKSKWQDVDSSFIDKIVYYESAKVLEVQIKGKQYAYFDVPKQTYQNFLKAPSKGKFFNEVILPRYKKNRRGI